MKSFAGTSVSTPAPEAAQRPAALFVQGLRKSYKDHEVLKGLDLNIPEGSVFALLGENGAGKTTVINILTTLLAADGGSAFVAGYDLVREPRQVRAALAVCGQSATVDEVLTGAENLELIARLRQVRDPRQTANRFLERFGLLEAGAKPVATYSGGMRRRLDIALSMVGDPRVIFLDEPTTGLDPASRRDVWESIENLARGGTTVVLTTQYMEEAERLADTIAVLRDGHIIAQGSSEEIREQAGGVENLEEAFLSLTAASEKASTPEGASIPKDADPSKRSASPPLLMAPRPGRAKTHLLRDCWTLTARMLKHNLRSMDTIMTVLGMPLLILLAFVFVLGGAMDTGAVRYVDYIVPTVLLMCIASGVSYTAFRVKLDVESGMFNRLRTMPIARSAILGGHALASCIVNGISCLALLLVALLIGYRPQADFLGWLEASALLLLSVVSFTVMGVFFGATAKTVEGSGMFSYAVIGLLFVSSGFAPTASMPGALQVFANHQPITPVINALRSTLLGQDAGSDLWVALVWLLAIVVVFLVLGTLRLRRRRG